MVTAIEFKEVYYCYSDTKNWVLKNINLKIPQGSFFVLIGPSGSGKSTLLLLARGFSQEYSGQLKGNIFVNAKNISSQTVGSLGSKIGLIFQNPALQLHQLRVLDEVMSAPMYQNLPYGQCQERAKKLINEILGKEFYYRSPSELSSGEQQKTALAATLSMKADILLLDEPFSFLDTKTDKEVLKIIVKLHQQGKTIVIATHDVEEIAKYATHMALLDKGNLVLQTSPKKVLYSQKMQDILTAPLSIKTAKALILQKKIFQKPLSWEELISQIKLETKKIKEKITKDKQKSILTLENISYEYSETKKGINNINLEIEQNEILGIIGANGSGKTTLVKSILGLIKSQKGIIKLKDKVINKMPTNQRAKKIGFVTQDPLDMFFETNLWDEVAAGPKFLKLENPKQKAEERLKQFNLWKYKDNHPDSISGGEKSLLGIADILVNNPEILILDEPEFGLDPKNWHKIVQIIKDLKKQGKTIILISQDLEILPFLCDRIVLMKDGEIIRIDTPKQIFTDFNLLKQANLTPLPMFSLLNYVSEKDFESEEKFIQILSKNAI